MTSRDPKPTTRDAWEWALTCLVLLCVAGMFAGAQLGAERLAWWRDR